MSKTGKHWLRQCGFMAALAAAPIMTANRARAAAKVTAKEFYAEPPTLISLGFE